MKYLLIGLIYIYKKIPGNFHKSCNFIPTCSTYAIDCLIKFPTFKAIKLIFKRIIRCNPFHTLTYDPAPEGDIKWRKS